MLELRSTESTRRFEMPKMWSAFRMKVLMILLLIFCILTAFLLAYVYIKIGEETERHMKDPDGEECS